MCVKTKIILFFVSLILVFVAGIVFGKSGLFASGGIFSAIWAAIFGNHLSRSSGSTKAADNAANDARAEASGNAASMDRMVQSGKSLVEQSEELIRETGRGAGSTTE